MNEISSVPSGTTMSAFLAHSELISTMMENANQSQINVRTSIMKIIIVKDVIKDMNLTLTVSVS